MKTQILLTIDHTKPLPDITDVICQRVWPYGGGCITDMTAAIQEPAPSSRNQCDGCAVGAHVNRWGNHCMPDGGLMACTANRYTPSAPATGTFRVGNETFSKERMREAIKAGRAQS